ncbi:MAG: InlB B-repeat-containing protein, partial [Firmicutes bacterium]|nr:InlB B-repeat-containing protein [Bacillota bacterium]
MDAPLSSDMTVYAKWNPIEYSIHYELFGGINDVDNPSSFNIIQEAILINNPTKEGYTFGGWYQNAEFTTVFDYTNMPAQDITLYAKWNINSYTLQFIDIDGSILQNADYEYESDISTVLAPNPTKEGYTFIGWDATLPLVMPANNVTLKAQYTINQYTITFDS